MRMWMLPTWMMCRQHLLGEHNEMHKWLPMFWKQHKVHGRFHPITYIQFNGYIERHDELAAEMVHRGYQHNTPMTQLDVPDFADIYPNYYDLAVDPIISFTTLMNRCVMCREKTMVYNFDPYSEKGQAFSQKA